MPNIVTDAEAFKARIAEFSPAGLLLYLASHALQLSASRAVK